MINRYYDVSKKIDGITPKSSLRVIWEDEAINYSKDKQQLIKAYFKNIYNTETTNVTFKPVHSNNGNRDIAVDTGENILDMGLQRKLFKEWLKLNNADVNFDAITRLDNRVNDVLRENRDLFDLKFKKWEIKRIEFDNFLSYGDGNVLDYDRLKGLTVINSVPQNQGGKSVLTVDLLLFLFFNTTSKTTKVGEIFNLYTDKDYVRVKGFVTIDGDQYIIERTLTRKPKKKGDEFSVTQELNFYKALPDGTYESLQEEKRQETEKLINKVVGGIDDFLLTVISTGNNLEDLISAKATQRSNVLNRFLGLEHLQFKEETAKKLYQDWRLKLKSNLFDIDKTLLEIKKSEDIILKTEKECCEIVNNLEKADAALKDKQAQRDDILTKKQAIDIELTKINIEHILSEIEKHKQRINGYDKEIGNLNNLAKTLQVEFNEDEYNDVLAGLKKLEFGINEAHIELKKTSKIIKGLKEGLACPTCKRAFDNNNETEINFHEEQLVLIEKRAAILEEQQTKGNEKLFTLNEAKKKLDELERIEIMRDKNMIDKENCLFKLKELTDKHKLFIDNTKKIEENAKLEEELININYLLDKLKFTQNGLKEEHQRSVFQVEKYRDEIEEKKKLIEDIKKEHAISKVFDHYIQMVGKNGIAKIILKNVVPIINLELEKLLFDIVNFNVKLEVADNSIEFWMDDCKRLKPLSAGSGFEKVIGALALRCILAKINCLPTPSILVLDEPFGKVAPENLEGVAFLLDRIKEYFSQVFLISHNPISKDWGDNVIMVRKVNDVSVLEF